jgi:hypothetical protein
MQVCFLPEDLFSTSEALLYQALILIGIFSFGCKQDQSPSEDSKKADNGAISIQLDLY